jgi:hypothetical protein
VGFSRYLWRTDEQIDVSTWCDFSAAALKLISCCHPFVNNVLFREDEFSFSGADGTNYIWRRSLPAEDGADLDERGRRYTGNCKTNGLPHDLPVGAIDLLMKSYLHESVKVSTDGGFMMCSGALSMIHDLIGRKVVNLAAISADLNEHYPIGNDEGALPWTFGAFEGQAASPLFRYEFNRQLVFNTYVDMNTWFPRRIQMGLCTPIELNKYGCTLRVGENALELDCVVRSYCRCGCNRRLTPFSCEEWSALHLPRFDLDLPPSGKSILEETARSEMPDRYSVQASNVVANETCSGDIPF